MLTNCEYFVPQEAITCLSDNVLDAPPKQQMPPAFAVGPLPAPRSTQNPASTAGHSAMDNAHRDSPHAADSSIDGRMAEGVAAPGDVRDAVADGSVNGSRRPEDTRGEPGDDQRHSPVTVLQSGGTECESHERSEKRLRSERVMVSA